jgi:isoprenylcysteine carboxyl methyltransferase (ICMT) family protein YpbQ
MYIYMNIITCSYMVDLIWFILVWLSKFHMGWGLILWRIQTFFNARGVVSLLRLVFEEVGSTTIFAFLRAFHSQNYLFIFLGQTFLKGRGRFRPLEHPSGSVNVIWNLICWPCINHIRSTTNYVTNIYPADCQLWKKTFSINCTI